MQLRLSSSIRLPGRYREDDIPPRLRAASFVHPTIPYNPSLPPPAFPTLEEPRPVDTRSIEAMTGRSRPASTDSDPEQEVVPKRATVFHGEMQLTNKLLQIRIPSSTESAEVSGDTTTSKFQEWELLDKNYEELKDYDGYGVMANDGGNNESPRVGLTAYELQVDWARVNDGLKLIIVMELTVAYSFQEATKKLILTEEEVNEIVHLYEREVARNADEDAKIANGQARQLERLMDGTLVTSKDSFSSSLDEILLTDLRNPAAFMISKTEISHAQSFLKSIKLNKYADRLWRYEGVATAPIINILGSKNIDPIPLSEEQLEPQALGGIRKRKEPLLRSLPKALPKSGRALLPEAQLKKRPREGSQLVKLKLSSGLRNAISGDSLEETIASGPAALQTTFSPRPAPPARRVLKTKKYVIPHIKPRKKNLPESPTSEPSSSHFYDPLLKTSDRLMTIGIEMDSGLPTTPSRHVKNRLLNQVAPNSPLPISEMTPSQPKRTSQTTPKVRLAQLGGILGPKLIATATGSIISDELDAPPTGVPLSISPDRTRDTSRHAEAKEMKDYARITDRGVADEHRGPGNTPNQKPMPLDQAQEEGGLTATYQNKRKFQGQEETASTAPNHKRLKVEGLRIGGKKRPLERRSRLKTRLNRLRSDPLTVDSHERSHFKNTSL